MLYFIALIFCSLVSTILSADSPSPPPIQYCNPDPTTSLSYCLALLAHDNPTTSRPDLYLTLSVSRPRSQGPFGWNAIGFGSTMSGALMFVIFGDPDSPAPPTLSVRTTPGHNAPRPIAEENTGKTSISAGFDTQLLKSEWITDDSSSNAVRAQLSFLIRSTTLWGGADIDTSAPLQPFIWAYNPTQSFPDGDFRANVDLEMHDHQSGYGNFYMNLSSAFVNTTETPTAPSILPDRVTIGAITHAPDSSDSSASSSPAARSFRNKMWHLHGTLMSASFLLFFPTGILAIRSGHPSPSFTFGWHWGLQLLASVTALLGMALGLLLSSAIVKWHQFVGLGVMVGVPVQVWMGWKHHVNFVETRARTRFVSDAHVWLGRGVMLAGYVNLLSGLFLREYGAGVFTGMVMAVVGETLLVGWAWKKWRKGEGVLAGRMGRKMVDGERGGGLGGRSVGTEEEYFALVDQEGESDEEDDESDLDGEEGKGRKAGAGAGAEGVNGKRPEARL